MDPIGIIGIILVLTAIYLGAPDVRIEPMAYLDLDSFILVFLGSIACILISSSISDIKVLLRDLFKKKHESNMKPTQAIEIMLTIAKEAQKALGSIKRLEQQRVEQEQAQLAASYSSRAL